MFSLKDAEDIGMGYSTNSILHGLHGKIFTHDNTIEITGIYTYYNFYETVDPGSVPS